MNPDFSTNQGNKLLTFRKTINNEKKTIRNLNAPDNIEGFENKELWTESKTYSDNVDQVIKHDMDELKALEDQFMKLLSEYSSNYKLYMTDVMNVIQSESNNYVGKNIETNDGVISYINNLGIARSYTNDTYESRHKSCGNAAPIKVNAENVTDLKFRKGEPMRKNEPCGYEGKNIYVNSDNSDIINLSLQPGAVASQKSSYQHGRFPAKNAIDGNMDTFNSTENIKGTWWQIELVKPSFIKNVEIYNRKDCCWDRFTTVRLDVLDSNEQSIYNTTIQRSVTNQMIFKVENINKVGKYVRLTQETDTTENYLHMSEVQVWGTEKITNNIGDVGYIDGNGILHQYDNNVIETTNQSCPTDKTGVDESLWNLFSKGINMNKNSVCDLGNLDIKLKTHVQELNKELMDVTQKINNKINETKNKIKQMKSQNTVEAQYLNEQLTRFKDLYKKYNNLDKKGYASLDAMIEDMNSIETSNVYTYIIWGMIAVIVLYLTMKHLR